MRKILVVGAGAGRLFGALALSLLAATPMTWGCEPVSISKAAFELPFDFGTSLRKSPGFGACVFSTQSAPYWTVVLP